MGKGLSPTQRTLAALRDDGLIAEIVERRLPARPGMPFGSTHDFLGIIDIIAIDSQRTIGIQSTGTDFSGHLNKLFGEGYAACMAWLAAPHRELHLYGWRKVKYKRGAKRMVYRPRIAVLTVEGGELVYDEL